MSSHRLILFLLGSFLIPLLEASYCHNKKVEIFFVNGVFNSRKVANHSALTLRNRLSKHFSGSPDLRTRLSNRPLVRLSYNLSENPLRDLMQAEVQKEVELKSNFWRWLSKLSLAPEWFRKLAMNTAQSCTQATYVLDTDLRAHVNVYVNQLKAGSSVLLVPHSQGNFYANLSYENVSNQNLEWNSSRFGIVAVASPASKVSANGEYFTLTGDGVINAVRMVLGSLPANASNSKNGYLDHEFIEHYLDGDNSGPLILDEIIATTEVLSDHTEDGTFKNYITQAFYQNPKKERTGFYDDSLLPAEIWAINHKYIPKPLQPEQCIAMAALSMHQDNQTGECEERNLIKSEEWLDACMANQWQEKTRYTYGDCYLYGLPTGGSYSHDLLSIVFQKNPECLWSKKKMLSTVTPELIEMAKAFLRKPDVQPENL